MNDGEVRAQIDRILASATFAEAERARKFLRFIVEATLAGRTGEIEVKITALTPSSSNTLVGVLWTGRNSSGTCENSLGAVFGQNNFAQVGLPAISTQILSGGYCLVLYDVGSFTTAVNYTVTVSHPE